MRPFALLRRGAFFEVKVHLAALACVSVETEIALRRQSVIATVASGLRGIGERVSVCLGQRFAQEAAGGTEL